MRKLIQIKEKDIIAFTFNFKTLTLNEKQNLIKKKLMDGPTRP